MAETPGPASPPVSGPGSIAGCTIVARNYVPYASVLAEGWRRHHPDAPLHVLVIDAGSPEDAAAGAPLPPGAHLVLPHELGLGDRALSEMRGIYGVAEFTTSLKPHLIRLLLDRGADVVVFLDSDTDVHADLGAAAAAAAVHGVALSAHLLAPPPLDGMSPNENEIAWSGIFNSGFLAVGPSGRAFLAWWASRLRRDCLFCEPMGTHADQLWLDLVPSFFTHHVLRDPGVNVAQWNLHERPIRWDGDRFTAAGAPLRTFHFSGFDPDDPRPGPDGWPAPLRFDLSAEPDLRRLCAGYAERLVGEGIRASRRVPYRHARTASGRRLATWERRAYREILLAAEARGAEADVPDPFDPAAAPDFERMIGDPQRMGLGPMARARVRDARTAELATRNGNLTVLWKAVSHSRQLARRVPVHRNGWMPYPRPSDRTRGEYARQGAPPRRIGRS